MHPTNCCWWLPTACRRFTAVDTSGLEPFLPGDSIQARATALTHGVLRRCDVALFLFDGRHGMLLPASQRQSLARCLVPPAPPLWLTHARLCAISTASHQLHRTVLRLPPLQHRSAAC